MEQEQEEQGYYRIPASVYFRLEATHKLMKWVWAPALLILVCCTAGLYDLRFLLVGLMLLLVVIPPLVAMVYFSSLLTPSARAALAPQRVEESDTDTLKVVYSDPALQCRDIPFSEIVSVQSSGKHICARSATGAIIFIAPACLLRQISRLEEISLTY